MKITSVIAANTQGLSERSFNKWCRNGGMDEPSFKWRAHPYWGVGGHRRKNSNQKVIMSSISEDIYNFFVAVIFLFIIFF